MGAGVGKTLSEKRAQETRLGRRSESASLRVGGHRRFRFARSLAAARDIHGPRSGGGSFQAHTSIEPRDWYNGQWPSERSYFSLIPYAVALVPCRAIITRSSG